MSFGNQRPDDFLQGIMGDMYDKKHDAYVLWMRAKGETIDSDSDDNMDVVSDSSDEDYLPESDSEVDDEYDSHPPDSEDSDDEDPDKPKKPLSAYHIWFSEERENIEAEVKQTNPDFCYYELVQSAAKMWRDDVDTDEYKDREREAMKKYRKAMEAYEQKRKDDTQPDEAYSYVRGGVDSDSADSSDDKGSDSNNDAENCEPDETMGATGPIPCPNTPNRPLSAYFIWMSEERDNIREKVKRTKPECTLIDVKKYANEVWMAMPNEEKAIYIEKAQNEIEDYEKAMEEFNRDGVNSLKLS